MVPKQCKRLAEVDFPIAAVSAHSAREKSIRHGHPSTLHLWWARRPLAACRAMLMALLLPDPADAHCPAAFKDEARRILLAFPDRPSGWDKTLKTDEGLRQAMLHKFIADFANWDNAANPAYLKTARALVKAAHGDEAPLVVDPFAGGGSIPLEALRIGCDAFASDLNPVACLINKVLLEDIPRHGPRLADELRRVAAEIKEQAEKELAEFYPPDPPDEDGVVARPIAYLWARTVRCEQPNCGCEIPLMRSFWLANKASRKRALRYKVARLNGESPHVEFEVFSPESEKQVPAGTVSRAKATCPACGKVLNPDRVRAQLTEQRGGADVKFDTHGHRVGGARLLAVALLKPCETGRQYRTACNADYRAVFEAQRRLHRMLAKWEKEQDGSLCPLPDEPTPTGGGSGAGRAFSIQKYGMMCWGDLFTARQKTAISELCGDGRSGSEHDKLHHSSAAGLLTALAIGRCTEQMSSLVRWRTTVEAVAGTFGRNALPIMWDFVEIQPTGDGGSNFAAAVEWVAEVVEDQGGAITQVGQVSQLDARRSSLPDDAAACFFTDPPYYDAIPYSDLADYFLVWLRRAIPETPLLGNPFEKGSRLSPKCPEIVQDEAKHLPDGRPKDRKFFEDSMADAFAEGRRILSEDGIGSVVFAHKTTEGWEALLSGMIRGGWVITGSWPVSTERPGRLRAQESAALSASVHLVCRPRNENAGVGDWGDIVRELPGRIAGWMERLSDEGIRGADLVFACIGPALELFSRYVRVETPDGEEVALAANENARGEPARRGFLSYVWEVAGRTALNQVLGSAEAKAKNGAAGALEEDARLTALFLWTLQATDAKAAAKKAKDEADAGDEDAEDEGDEEDGGSAGGKKKGLTLIYDVARRFAQPLGIHMEVWEGRIIETAKGIVRLLPVQERAKQLFGEDGASAVVRRFETAKKPDPQALMSFMADARAEVPEVKAAGRKKAGGASAEGLRTRKEATTLDRVHAAMLLQSSGASNALRALLAAEIQRGPDFLRLANALSALYPRDSEEKRLLDAMLLAVPR